MLNQNSNKQYKSLFFKDDSLPFIEARFVVDSDYHYTKHSHDTLSIGAVEKGQVAYLHKTNKYILKQNELSIINPNIVHCCNPMENGSRTYHMIYVNPAWCKGIQATIFGEIDSYIDVNKVQLYDKNLYQKYLNLNYTLLDKHISSLEKEELLESFFRQLFINYCDKKSINTIDKIHTTKIKKKIDKAKEFIENNCLENITINDISEYIGLSKFYFIKLFKNTAHLSPHEYLLNCKINIAKKLLSKGLNITEVANRVGFFDQSHFSKVFKKYVAATPNEYKNNIIN